MFAFVGYMVQANGIHFPWALQMPTSFNPDIPLVTYADISAAGGPADQWDALPTAAKVQIFGMIAFLEVSCASPARQKEPPPSSRCRSLPRCWPGIGSSSSPSLSSFVYYP